MLKFSRIENNKILTINIYQRYLDKVFYKVFFIVILEILLGFISTEKYNVHRGAWSGGKKEILITIYANPL